MLLILLLFSLCSAQIPQDNVLGSWERIGTYHRSVENVELIADVGELPESISIPEYQCASFDNHLKALISAIAEYMLFPYSPVDIDDPESTFSYLFQRLNKTSMTSISSDPTKDDFPTQSGLTFGHMANCYPHTAGASACPIKELFKNSHFKSLLQYGILETYYKRAGDHFGLNIGNIMLLLNKRLTGMVPIIHTTFVTYQQYMELCRHKTILSFQRYHALRETFMSLVTLRQKRSINPNDETKASSAVRDACSYPMVSREHCFSQLLAWQMQAPATTKYPSRKKRFLGIIFGLMALKKTNSLARKQEAMHNAINAVGDGVRSNAQLLKKHAKSLIVLRQVGDKRYDALTSKNKIQDIAIEALHNYTQENLGILYANLTQILNTQSQTQAITSAYAVGIAKQQEASLQYAIRTEETISLTGGIDFLSNILEKLIDNRVPGEIIPPSKLVAFFNSSDFASALLREGQDAALYTENIIHMYPHIKAYGGIVKYGNITKLLILFTFPVPTPRRSMEVFWYQPFARQFKQEATEIEDGVLEMNSGAWKGSNAIAIDATERQFAILSRTGFNCVFSSITMCEHQPPRYTPYVKTQDETICYGPQLMHMLGVDFNLGQSQCMQKWHGTTPGVLVTIGHDKCSYISHINQDGILSCTGEHAVTYPRSELTRACLSSNCWLSFGTLIVEGSRTNSTIKADITVNIPSYSKMSQNQQVTARSSILRRTQLDSIYRENLDAVEQIEKSLREKKPGPIDNFNTSFLIKELKNSSNFLDFIGAITKALGDKIENSSRESIESADKTISNLDSALKTLNLEYKMADVGSLLDGFNVFGSGVAQSATVSFIIGGAICGYLSFIVIMIQIVASLPIVRRTIVGSYLGIYGRGNNPIVEATSMGMSIAKDAYHPILRASRLPKTVRSLAPGTTHVHDLASQL